MLKRPVTRLELAILAVLILAAAVYATVTNAFTDLIETTAATVGNPASGNERIYGDSGTHKLSCLTSSGGSCSPTGGGGGFIQTLTAPSSGSFTQQNYNTGSGVVTTQVNNSSPVTSITILQHDPNNTKNIAALDKAKLAATFTLTEAFSGVNGGPGNGSTFGLWLSDGGSPPNSIFLGYQNGIGFAGYTFPNFVASGGTLFSAFNSATPIAPLVWLRVQETVSARIYSVSSDGITFAQVFTEANTAHFTTSRYGTMVVNSGSSSSAPDSMETLYSFSESNP